MENHTGEIISLAPTHHIQGWVNIAMEDTHSLPSARCSSRLRILTVSAFFAGHGGGIEVVAGNLAHALAERGHDSVWAAANLDTPPSLGKVTTIPLSAFDPIERAIGLPMPLLSPAALKKLDQQVKAADAVLIHDALYIPSIIAAARARRYGKPSILLQHIGVIPYSRAHLRFLMRAANSIITRRALRNAPQVVFISEAVRRQFGGLAFQRPPQLLFNGVDSQLFHPANDSERRSLRAALMTDEFKEILLFVGRFVEKKGLGVVRALAERRPQSLFLMAGSGPIAPGRWQLPNVRDLGKCTQARLAELYRAADALLLPSIGEGYPLVVQEAMASGLSILCGLDSASADPGAGHHLSGLLVDHSDPAGTAERFDRALSVITREPNTQGAAYAQSRYSWPANAQRVEALITAQI